MQRDGRSEADGRVDGPGGGVGGEAGEVAVDHGAEAGWPAGAGSESESTFEVGDGRPLAGSRADGLVGAPGVEAVDLGVHADRNGRERALQQASHEVRALVALTAGERELLLAVAARGGDHRPV